MSNHCNLYSFINSINQNEDEMKVSIFVIHRITLNIYRNEIFEEFGTNE